MVGKRISAVGNFVGCSGVRRKKYPLAFNVYTNGAVAKRMFAHGRLLGRVESEKKSSKISTCSALFLSWSVGLLVGTNVSLEDFSTCCVKVRSGMDKGSGVGSVMLLDAGVG